MKEKQAIIALAHFCACGELKDFARLASLVEPATALEILLTYTPLLTPSSDLKFIREITGPREHSNHVDIMETLAPTSPLHLLLDVSVPLLDARCHTLKSHVYNECRRLRFDPTSDDLLLEFIQARTRRLDLQLSVDYDDSLFELVEESPNFQHWWDTVLAPFKYLTTQGAQLPLNEFEQLQDFDKAVIIVKTVISNEVIHLAVPFERFLTASRDKTILSHIIKHVKVATTPALKLLDEVIKVVYPEAINKDECLELIESIYKEFQNPNVEALESMNSTLLSVCPTPARQTGELINAINAAKAFPLQFRSLADLTELCREPSKQKQFFADIIDSLTPRSASLFLAQTSVLRPALFPSIDERTAKKLVMSRFLSLRLYSDIDISPQDEELVIDHFWTCFKTATNGSKDRGELNAGYRALQIVQPPSDHTKRLLQFVDAVDELFQYSIYFVRGTPLRPIDLLTVDDLSTVAQKLLELNNDSYREPKKIHELLQNLSLGLNAQLPSLADIECHCIDSSLVHHDFTFAYTGSMKLFKSAPLSTLESKWDSLFQVAKYVPPEWPEEETPEWMVRQQMDLLSHIVAVAPIKHAQAIVQHWGNLDMDLTVREEEYEEVINNETRLTQQPRSLEKRLANALSSTASELLKDQPVSNMLANGLGWAIGGGQ